MLVFRGWLRGMMSWSEAVPRLRRHEMRRAKPDGVRTLLRDACWVVINHRNLPTCPIPKALGTLNASSDEPQGERFAR